jgi:hypothetical protein
MTVKKNAPMETIYIQLQNPPKGMNHARSVEGRAAAKNWEKINNLARTINSTPLEDFMGEGTDEWYSPSEGLVAIRKLIPRIAADLRSHDQGRLLIRDLNSYENILSAADARGSKFRFSAQRDNPA